MVDIVGSHIKQPEELLARANDTVTALPEIRAGLREILAALVMGKPELIDLSLALPDLQPNVAEEIGLLLASDAAASEQAKELGDILRASDTDSGLNPEVIECYRTAFYLSDRWEEYAKNPLYARFLANKAGLPFDKWIHYFEVYHRVLAPYVGRPVRVLEIGVFHGGGLEQLRALLGAQAELIGMDIDPSSKLACAGRFEVAVGDQTDPDFLAQVVAEYGPFDVIIDDGGHTMRQQISSIEFLFPSLQDGGVYIVEDTHTSYWTPFQDADTTFMEWAKQRVDDVNAYHFSKERDLSIWTTSVSTMQFFDSIVVFEKANHLPPFCEVAGTGSFIHLDRNPQLWLLAYRAALEVSQTEADRIRQEAHNQVLAAEAARATADAARQGLQDTLDSVEHSGSWRLTAPLRKLKRKTTT